MKKALCFILTAILLATCTAIYTSAETVKIESGGTVYEFDPELYRDYMVTETMSFADCYWVLYDDEVDRGSTGDVNSDGYINGLDCVWILQYIAGWDLSGYTVEEHGMALSAEAGDVTGDGKVNLYDVSLLMKYCANWFERGVIGGSQDQNLILQWFDLKDSNDKNGVSTAPYFEWIAERGQ